jgi:hypothetical protein
MKHSKDRQYNPVFTLRNFQNIQSQFAFKDRLGQMRRKCGDTVLVIITIFVIIIIIIIIIITTK